ncbi:MAG: ATPase P [Oscillospiraceae bacterium]|nr:ATPase P [Oscillospiraceae bacterium]
MNPRPRSKKTLDPETLKKDRNESRVFASCAVGAKALYLGGRFVDRLYYVPVTAVKRAYKKVAMSKGGFTGKGIFGSIAYLVLEYDDTSFQVTFKHEDALDQMLADIRMRHPKIKTVSASAERRLAKAEEERQARKKPVLTAEDQKTIEVLNRAKDYLSLRLDLCAELSAASREKRVYERSNPAYKWVALAIVVGGTIAAVFGVWSLVSGNGDFGLYFLLFGAAAVLLFSGANVLPTARNNKKAIEARLLAAREKMEQYLAGYPDFPLPAKYAHPNCLTRMVRSVEEGRASSVAQSYEDLKKGLRILNASTSVSQEEYDEIMAIKPMFLLEDYQ